MAIFQTATGQRRDTPPTIYTKGTVGIMEETFVFSTAFAFATDKVELLILPARTKIVDYLILPENLNGNATIGLMSGTPGVADNARTVGAELASAQIVASTAIRGAANAALLLAATTADVSIGFTNSADIVAGGTKKLTLRVLYQFV